MSASTAASPARQHGTRVAGTRDFLRHLIEMVLAMIAGMMVLGALESAILSVAGTSVSHVENSAPEAVALVMALNMTAGMTLWMRHRGHSRVMCAEMACAMVIPAIAAIVLFWCGVIHSGPSLLSVEHAAMIPAMIAIMLVRRREYSEPVVAASRRNSVGTAGL
jgi:hypothetical protein